jgi:preprotein translocase subunit YajC
MIEPVLAQAAPGAMDYFNSLLIPTILIIGVMYFLMIRPQQKRMRAHQEMIGALRRGDNVVTAGGILGKITKVDDDEVQIEVAEGVRIRVLKSTISEVRGKPEPANSNDKPAAKTSGRSKSGSAS